MFESVCKEIKCAPIKQVHNYECDTANNCLAAHMQLTLTLHQKHYAARWL